MAKEIERDGFFEQLTYLFLSDDSTRWKGLLIIIAVGAVVGSTDLLSDNNSSSGNVTVGMSIVMLITAICLFAFYSFTHTKASSDKAAGLRIPSLLAGALCSFAVAFGGLSYSYQTKTLYAEFGKAIEAHDYARLASVTEQASTVSGRLHTSLLEKSDQAFVTATKQPSTWDAVLTSLSRVSAPVPPGTRLIVHEMEHALFIAPGQSVSNLALNVSAVTGDAIVVIPSAVRTPPLVDRVVFEGGRQTLDGFEWKNVTFVGTHLFYRGGVVKLEGVRFVNCTFDLPPDPRGAKIAQYVALNRPMLEIGSAAS
jgi:hypothetical protein